MELTMNHHNNSSSAEFLGNASQAGTPSPSADWIFSMALSRCDDVIRIRQQSVLIDRVSFDANGGIDGELLSDLLAKVLRDMSQLSRRGAVLSLTAADAAIVIQSNHPLDIPGPGLEIDSAIQQEAKHLHVAAEMIWDQGRGPRITLRLPSESCARTESGRC